MKTRLIFSLGWHCYFDNAILKVREPVAKVYNVILKILWFVSKPAAHTAAGFVTYHKFGTQPLYPGRVSGLLVNHAVETVAGLSTQARIYHRSEGIILDL